MTPNTFAPTRTFTDADGYIVATDGRSARYVHRLVWEAVYGVIPRGWHVHHRNAVRTDNRIENLELLTPAEHYSRHADAIRERARRQPRDAAGRFALAA